MIFEAMKKVCLSVSGLSGLIGEYLRCGGVFQLLSSGEMKGRFTILMDPQIGGVTRHSLFLHHNTK